MCHPDSLFPEQLDYYLDFYKLKYHHHLDIHYRLNLDHQLTHLKCYDHRHREYLILSVLKLNRENQSGLHDL
jgi:hypothetical protein